MAQNYSDSIKRRYYLEQWLDMGYGYDVQEMVTTDKFHQAAESFHSNSSRELSLEVYEGIRKRGYITAPETGNYTFWVSAKASGQIWLSTDDTKYRKELLCYIGSDSGSGTDGVRQNAPNLWDQYATQMSEEVYLEAGEKYYFEALGKSGHAIRNHLSVGWATPTGERELIPLSVISSYALESTDEDDDFLPDEWEIEYGLDPADNGLLDRVKQGERGDFDNDGVNNRLEYVLGLDPTDSDTDNDGLSDGEEVLTYQTNPLVSDAPSELLISDVNLLDYSSAGGLAWNETSVGLVPTSFRGTTTWNFEVPSNGYWSLNIFTKLLGEVFASEKVDFNIAIDGGNFVPITVTYGSNGQGLLRYLTPYLESGAHTLTLNIDNLTGRRTVSIQSIQVLEPTGADLDGDGISDWVLSKVQEANHIRPYRPISATSPAFIEGVATDRASVSVDGGAVTAGVDDNHWYANVPLAEQGSTEFPVNLTSQLNHESVIQWASTNIFDTTDFSIRKGDSVKLMAQPHSGATGGSVQIEFPVVNLALNPQAVASQVRASRAAISTDNPASFAIDGNVDGRSNVGSTARTFLRYNAPWWQVDLGAEYELHSVKLWNNLEVISVRKRLSNYRISILDASGATVIFKDFHTSETYTDRVEDWVLDTPVRGSRVRVEKLGRDLVNTYRLSLTEVQVFGRKDAVTLTDTDYHVYECYSPGLNTFQATHANGESASLTLDVKSAFISGPKDFVNNVTGYLSYIDGTIDAGLTLDGGESLITSTVDEQSNVIQVASLDRGDKNLLWRLSEDGPILASQPLNFIGLSDAAQVDLTSTFLSREFDGYNEILTPIVLTDIPPGGEVFIRIFRNGVTFLDGTKSRVLTAADFQNDIANLRFLFPIGMTGGYCHYVTVYDRYGNAITRR